MIPEPSICKEVGGRAKTVRSDYQAGLTWRYDVYPCGCGTLEKREEHSAGTF